ncbi:MAG: SgcJ/EcaC family oxidoreductase [Deltaproteobacteria bacterium]|nr:SgcJ/EcaC family oxidoreductase [Deltaproteobacteria bacterium]
MHALLLAVALTAAPAQRPILISVDDLPIASGKLHPDPAERLKITQDLLAVLARHHVPAIGMVVGKNHTTPADEALLDLWVKAGLELGNHTFSHPDASKLDAKDFIADADKERAWLARFLAARGKTLRYFRYPYLDEGETPAKLDTLRAYLASSHQTNLPVTIDDQDWSFEDDWVAARRKNDAHAMAEIAADYQAALRIHVEHFEAESDKLFGHAVPEIVLLHAEEVSAAQWDAFFTWLESTGHRFAGVDEVMADPAYQTRQTYVGPHGISLWDRIRVERRKLDATSAIAKFLQVQVAAWNRGDLETFTRAYADDATFVSPSGFNSGRAAVLERYKRKYPDRKAMGRLSLELQETRLLEGDEFTYFGDTVPSHIQGATVAARWKLELDGKPAATGTTLLVLRPVGDGWEILQDASM